MKEITKTSSEKIIAEAKNSFSKLLKTSEYQTILYDDNHRKKLIELMKIKQNGAYLDLATGTGYVAFAIAEQYPSCLIVGLDIVDEIIIENLKKKKIQSLSNIDFKIYNGIKFQDFEIKFDGVICRYAFHHFPKIDVTLEEISKVLKKDGIVVIADAIRNEHDNEDFINRFQGLKKDGHVRMYTGNEMVSLFEKHNFTEVESFSSKVTASRELDSKYIDLLKTVSSEVKEKYCVKVDDKRVIITFDILNIAFRKS